MSNRTTFDNLPNELILSIFSYLKTHENYYSFFDCNQRLRQLVKRYVNYSRHSLRYDIKRFSTLHSWYKHLSYIDGGETFYLVPIQGEQMRYSFDPRISDPIGIHWHFCEQSYLSLNDKTIENILKNYPIKLNPSFYPRTLDRILASNGLDHVRRYHSQLYPILLAILYLKKSFDQYQFSKDYLMNLLELISQDEQKRLQILIEKSAYFIWKDIQQLEHFNILQIHYSHRK